MIPNGLSNDDDFPLVFLPSAGVQIHRSARVSSPRSKAATGSSGRDVVTISAEGSGELWRASDSHSTFPSLMTSIRGLCSLAKGIACNRLELGAL